MARPSKLRLLREKKLAALAEIAKLEGEIAELRSLVSDYEVTERVLSSLADSNDEIQGEAIGKDTSADQLPPDAGSKKPEGAPTVPQMIYEALRKASLLGAGGLEPSAMLQYVQQHYWQTATPADVGSTAWRLWKEGKLKKSATGSIYSLPDGAENTEPSRKGGRQIGAIDMKWRAALRELYQRGGGHSYVDIMAAAENAKMIIGIASIRERVRRFIAQGIMSADAEGNFLVTDSIAERFGFTKTT